MGVMFAGVYLPDFRAKCPKMYYHKSTEINMKKTFASFFVLFSAALPAVCASTCETRVDAHQDASTRQRVEYCLTPEKAAPVAPGPEVLYYGVSSAAPTNEAAADEKQRKQVYFDKDGVAVSQNYVDTSKFPTFTNDTLSEQEKIALEEAQKKQALLQAEQKAKSAQEKPARTMSAEQKVTLANETKAGLLARQTKAKRYMKEVVQQPEPDELAQAYQQGNNAPEAYNPNYEPETYSTQTATAPANDFEADLNAATPAYSADGAAPAGFTDPSLASDQGFGYNATDPAMQQ